MEYHRRGRRDRKENQSESVREVEDDAFQAFLENAHVEVHQQGKTASRELQVGHHLSGVDGIEVIDRLQLDDDRFLDQEIQAITAIDAYSLVDDRQFLLPFDTQPTLEQFIPRQAS